ncbi:MAG TPA: hypothetical protein VGK44_13000 [Casimicrobiaceae bacterium]
MPHGDGDTAANAATTEPPASGNARKIPVNDSVASTIEPQKLHV